MAASHGSNGGNYVGMSLMLLHLGSRQLYMGPKQRPVLFTTAAGADWDRGGSVCFDLLSSWRRGKFGLAFLGGALVGGEHSEMPSARITRKARENQQTGWPPAILCSSACTSHARPMQKQQAAMFCEGVIGGRRLLKRSATRP
jgi:hypothetical protein